MKRIIIVFVVLLMALMLASCIQIQIPAGSDDVQSSWVPSTEPGHMDAPSPTADITQDDILSYFNEIALKSEYGGGDFDGIIRRWEQPIRFEIDGNYSDEDYKTLTSHIDALKVVEGMPEISIVESGGNYKIHFVKLDQMSQAVPGYVKGNWGFVNLTWDDQGKIIDATVGIATDITNQVQRNHLILEETTQGLGLLNDSAKYMDSIYQIQWTEVQSLTPLDWLLVKMLYSPAVRAGMKQDESLPALKAWLDSN